MQIQNDQNDQNDGAAESSYRVLVDSITDYAIYMLDPSGVVANWNAGAQRFKGYASEEIVGQHFSRFYTEEDRAAGIPERNLKQAETAGRFEEEGWRVRKDGTRFWASVVIDRILGQNGELIGFAKITRDLTERRDAQLKLEEAREALFQAQKMEAIGQLTGGIAHDFNNLLMAILGSLEIVSQRLPHDPRISPFLDNAIKGAQRGATLTQRMLAFARRQELTSGPVDVVETVNSMREMLDRSLGPNFLLTLHMPPDLLPVLTDRAQLESAVLNLVVNARDAMPSGGQIVISAEQATSANGEAGILLTVRDDGEGMDAATLMRAAEPFFTTKGVGKGTGLGLSMVHGLAEQSGGKFLLESSPGKGTTAKLWLPLAGRGVPNLAPMEQPETSAYSPKQVLVVDDDALVLLNTVTLAEELGHTVIEASSAAEALAVLRERPVDLVITDYAMPRMNGGQLAQAIAESWPEVKVIIATGYSEMPEELKGRFERLGKPFWSHDLKGAIERTFKWRLEPT